MSLLSRPSKLIKLGIDNFRKLLSENDRSYGTDKYDINMVSEEEEEGGDTLLHRLCSFREVDDLILSQFLEVMLSRADVDVNAKDDNGQTAFDYLIFHNTYKPLCIRVMFTNNRVDDLLQTDHGLSLLQYRLRHSSDDEVIKLLLALGPEREKNSGGDCTRPVWLYGRPGHWLLDDPSGYNPNTFYYESTRRLITNPDSPTNRLRFLLEVGQTRLSSDLFKILNAFVEDPKRTIFMVQLSIGRFNDTMAASVFSALIFLCDDLLKFKGSDGSSGGSDDNYDNDSTARFFRIATKLPLEMQMILCYRLSRSTKDLIPSVSTEAGLRYEALVWLLQSVNQELL